MRVLETVEGHKIYDITTDKSLPEWLKGGKRHRLRYDKGFQDRLELLQYASFPGFSSSLSLSGDGNYLLATGGYPPQMKIFELDELALKVERHTDAAAVKGLLLSDDFSKVVQLREDRRIEFHAKFGVYETVRMPIFLRDGYYQPQASLLYLVGSDAECYRLSLDLGRHLAPVPLPMNRTHNALAGSTYYDLIFTGGDAGHMSVIDARAPSSGRMGVQVGARGVPITCIEMQPRGVEVAVGLQSGLVKLYDLRASKPLCVKDHQNDEAIRKVRFSGRYVVSGDRHVVKVWDREGETAGFVDMGEAPLTDMLLYPDSGLLIAATDSPRLRFYYLPFLGPAPRWCAFLDNVLEDMERQQARQEVVYDDYKFVTEAELADLGGDHLIGTSFLRPHMHGYFMRLALYQRLAEEEVEEKAPSSGRNYFEKDDKIAPKYSQIRQIDERFTVAPGEAENYAKKAAHPKMKMAERMRRKLERKRRAAEDGLQAVGNEVAEVGNTGVYEVQHDQAFSMSKLLSVQKQRPASSKSLGERTKADQE